VANEAVGLRIDFPWDGDVLNRHDGVEDAEGLTVTVQGRAWPGATITAQAKETRAAADGSFAIPIRLQEREQTIQVTAASAARSEAVPLRLYWDRRSRRRFRFSVDDNVLFLRDLARHPERYDSLFDHWYLRLWQEMHERFGAKIHINIYWTDGGDFTLAQVPDKWRGEWQANADWLHLTFHARQDKPDRIYRQATYEELAADIERVHEQIVRFAGEEVMSPWTTLHWAECPREAARALREAGYRGLIALAHEPCETCTTVYYLSAAHCRHLAQRDAWKDFDMDLLFINCDLVVNTVRPWDVRPRLEQQGANPHTGELLELLIHEQYFRQDLPLYQYDVVLKVEEALKFAVERGYEPVFWADEFLRA
jgi:hypothetical protein